MADPLSQLHHRGQRAVQRMVEYAPASGALALWVHHEDRGDGLSGGSPDDSPAARRARALERGAAPAEPPVTTDGRVLRYAAGFEALPLELQTGWVAHAVLHVALRHAQRFDDLRRRLGDADLRLFNLCADAVVNSAISHLRWLQLPAGALRLQTLLGEVLGLDQPDELALLEWDVERLYHAVDDRLPTARGGDDEASRNSRPQPRRDGPRATRLRQLGAGEPADLAPAADLAERAEDEAAQTREWTERLLRAHAGDGAHSVLRALLADLPRVRTPWEQVLRAQAARALSRRPGPSWSRPSRSYLANQGRSGPHRRMPWEPGTTASRAVPRLALVVDVSASIDDALLERFAREVDAITRRLEARLLLVVGDDALRHVQEFEPGRSDLRRISFQGRGGTDFTPLLEEADRHRPDLVVVLTDLEGPARHRPRCPVLWAVPESQRAVAAPFGRTMVLR